MHDLVDQAKRTFLDLTGHPPEVISWAPGRINLIGEHTDYTEGLAVPAAINRWVVVAIGPRTDQRIRVLSTTHGALFEAALGDEASPSVSWHRYMLGALQEFSEEHALPTGLDAVVHGNVPLGAGLSSSAALLVAWMNGLARWTGRVIDPWATVRLAQRVEHRHLDVQCGLLDQVASQFSQAGSVLLIDFKTLQIEVVPNHLNGLSWVMLHTGVQRALTSSAYAERVRECKQGLMTLQARFPDLEHYRDITLDMLDGDAPWVARLKHFVSENARVRTAALMLAKGDAVGLGALLRQSHDSLRRNYQVSCDELDYLIQLASAHPAWLGGRMMGGGFGGCTLNLVKEPGVNSFIETILSAYRQHFPSTAPKGFVVQLVGGAQVE